MFCLDRVFVKHKRSLNSPARRVQGQAPWKLCTFSSITKGQQPPVDSKAELRHGPTVNSELER